MASIVLLLVFSNVLFLNYANGHLKLDKLLYQNAFDLELYKNVLDPDLCREQIEYMIFNKSFVLAEFLDAGAKMPRGILTGNYVDMGNYFQCLNIHRDLPNSALDGKYCLISVPLDQDLKFPMAASLGLPDVSDFLTYIDFSSVGISEQLLNLHRSYNKFRAGDFESNQHNRSSPANPLSGSDLRLGVCIPKACSTRQIVDELMDRTASISFEFTEKYCRLPNDKPWVTADYVALVVFSVIGFITLLCTAYDVRHTIFLERDPKEANKIYQSFSIYTNIRRLLTYTPVPGTIECLDGVRTLAITWVIIGHTFVLQIYDPVENTLDIFKWVTSVQSLWIIAAPITVDTFFMLSGMLLVYTVAGKLTQVKLLKNLHIFYLLRLLRIFPILAIAVLMQASILNHVSDGPYWGSVVEHVHRCRQFWWSTLLHVQNFANPENMCLEHTWFLAIDMQLHLLSPLVLFWILGRRKKTACIALAIAILFAFIPASVYNFFMEFPSSHVAFSQMEKQSYFMNGYYVNTLTRCSPYFVGMVYGYLLHCYRDKKVAIPKLLVAILWMFATVVSSAVIYVIHPVIQLDWNNQTVDAIINSFMRPAWAVALGWLVFACAHGYGGPVNWVLSLRMWKLLSRLSYTMYIVHYPIIAITYSTIVAPTYFTVNYYAYKFLSDFCLTVMVAFILTLLVDSPCSTLIKLLFGKGFEKSDKRITETELTKNKAVNESTYKTHV